MMKTSLKSLMLLSMFIITAPLSAAPKVVVSVAPLHSLVSSLMQGVADPTLLVEENAAYDKTLDVFQKSHLITADMLIWSGSGLETSITRMIEEMPLLDNKLLTLTNYVPLLGRIDASAPIESRQLSRELAFWNDPRLAIMAVRMITPRLVRIDPDHQELYLENEIRLLKQLKELENGIASSLSGYDAVAPGAHTFYDPYFIHRFIAPSVIASNETAGFRKVSVGRSEICANSTVDLSEVRPESAYYFDAMQLTAKSLSSCMWHKEGGSTLANQVGNTIHES